MLKDRFILATITIALVALQLAIWPVLLKISELPEDVIFWHTLPPAGRLAPAEQLWLIPGVAAIFMIINIAGAYFFYRRSPLISQTLTAITALVSILAATTIIKTILIYTTFL